MIMKKLLHFSLLLFSILIFGQAKKDTITRRANIKFEQKINTIRFYPETPPLIPIAGAPKPSYTYLWETGDGHYSREAEPKHVYKNKGTYKTQVAVTNNYDNGKPPVTRPKTVVINEISTDLFQDVASISELKGLDIQRNCDPIPNQEMVVVMSYQNMENYVTNGKLYLFYNEKQFKNDNFLLTEFRAHNNEREIKENTIVSTNDLEETNKYLASAENFILNQKYKKTTTEEDLDATLLEANKTYKNVNILEFDNDNPNETRNVFFTFKTTPEMIKDTSATVTIRSVFVPNRSFKNHKIKNLEMEIVTSHDPNKMGSNGSLLNYRTVRKKRINFKTRFQNNGEGPATMIRLETDIPDMFDKKTLQIEDMYPKCPICPKGEEPTTSCLDTLILKKQIHFTFKNIYIPGSTQKNVKDIDSTKGFVKYSLMFGKDFHKTKTKSKTAIIFDKNEPIITNYATTRFMPGISIGAKTGYNLFPDLLNSKSYFVGATVSPYKSYNFYCQAELLNSFHNYTGETNITNEIITGNGAINPYLKRTTTASEYKNINWEIPLLIRYNINNYVAIGAGLQANINISEKQDQSQQVDIYENTSTNFLVSSTSQNNSFSNSFTNFKAGILLDANFGAARIGPSLGARYVLNFKENFNYMQFYALWKF